MEKVNQFPSVDIIVCYRNEKRFIKNNAESILAQDYPQHLFNIIYVNDHSDDGSEFLIPKTSKILAFELGNKQGKKEAQRLGIQNSTAEFLVFSDADCIYPSTWLRSFVTDLLQRDKELLCGSVTLIEERGFLSFYQFMDFKINKVLTQFCLERAKVALGSAANMMVSKRFLDHLGSIPFSGISSGDDVFLLQTALKAYPNSVGFTSNIDTSVITSPEASWKDLTSQRRRWMSKYTHFGTKEKLFFGCIGILDALLILLGFLSFTSGIALACFLGFSLIKALLYYRMIEGVSFFKLFVFLPLQTIYNLYLAALSMLFPRPKWKDRRIHV